MRLKTIIPSLLLTLFCAACSKEQANIPEAKGHITFTVSGESRNTQGSTFEKGDAIGVFVRNSGADFATNSKYVYDGKKFNPATEADDIVITKGSDFDFYVYYPYDETQRDITNITHTSVNQDALSGWLSSDFLSGSYTEKIIDFCVPLNFQHRNSTVEVHINKNDGEVTGAVIKNVKYRSSYNLLTGETKVDDTVTDLSMYSYKPDEKPEYPVPCDSARTDLVNQYQPYTAFRRKQSDPTGDIIHASCSGKYPSVQHHLQKDGKHQGLRSGRHNGRSRRVQSGKYGYRNIITQSRIRICRMV